MMFTKKASGSNQPTLQRRQKNAYSNINMFNSLYVLF